MKIQYTVGELAKRMKVSVRTLQYYDQQGLLKPSGYTDGGRRLYDAKDVVQLQQILSLKYLGLSLDEIKTQVSSISTADDVKKMLDNQMRNLESQIEYLQQSLAATQMIHAEIDETQTPDFSKIASIIISVRLKEEGFWWNMDMFNEDTGGSLKQHIQNRAGQDSKFGLRVSQQFDTISNKMYELVQKGVAPTSTEGQTAAKELWDMVQDFTGGDINLLPEVLKFGSAQEDWLESMKKRQAAISQFMGDALAYYMEKNNIDLRDSKSEG